MDRLTRSAQKNPTRRDLLNVWSTLGQNYWLKTEKPDSTWLDLKIILEKSGLPDPTRTDHVLGRARAETSNLIIFFWPDHPIQFDPTDDQIQHDLLASSR